MKRNNYIATLILATLCINGALAQTKIPRLVVTVTIDQLRSDYMEAFNLLYGEGGFNRFLKEGRIYERAYNDFFPVDRASASATLSTGATPYYNGIVSASWLDRNTLRPTYCTDDRKFKVSMQRDAASPSKLLVTTVGDELKVYTQGAAKVYSIAPNKESAILSSGHAADCAVWLDDNTGHWTTTDYYKSLNSWFSNYDRVRSVASRIKDTRWTPITELSGNVSFFMNGGTQKPFNHSFTGSKCYVDYKRSALVNTDITELAISCAQHNTLGRDDITDLLSVTYYAGLYRDGSLSQCCNELQDTYFRLDLELERLISNIEQTVGKENVMFILTSTGYSDIANDDYAQIGIPTGTFYINRTSSLLNMYLSAIYGQAQYVDAAYHNQIYLNHPLIEQKRLSLTDLLIRSREFLTMCEGVRDVHTAERILSPGNADAYKIRNAYSPTLCGDIIIDVAPGWKVVNEDNGEVFNSCVSNSVFPIIFYGSGIQAERISTLVSTDCVAPTICKSIRIRAPNACKSLPLF